MVGDSVVGESVVGESEVGDSVGGKFLVGIPNVVHLLALE